MSARQNKTDSIHLEKVGPCLYRCAPSGVYYGLIKPDSKQIRRSLDTKDLPFARRKLQDLRRDIALTDLELGPPHAGIAGGAVPAHGHRTFIELTNAAF